jgi:glycosyltransferase involved in cell wall biosynthesis
MKKIAFVAEYIAPPDRPKTGGLDALTYNLAKCLSNKYDVHVITSYLEHSERTEIRDNITIHRVGPQRKEIQRGDFLKRAMYNHAVESRLVSLKPDLINAIGFVSWNGAYNAAKRMNIPVIATVLEIWQGDWISNVGFFTGMTGEILERIYLKRNYSKYIAISKFTGNKLENKLKIHPEKISIVYCGVDLKEISSIKIDEKYPTPTIITVCRLVEYKRVQDIIQAVAQVKITIPNIKLKIVGEGPYRSVLEKLVVDNNLINNVEFCGKIGKDEDLIATLKRSHIFILGSTVEGFGMVIIEAMASGIPFIASDIPAVNEITDGGLGGFLVTPCSPQEIAEGIRKLMKNPELYAEKMEEGARLVKRYDWDYICCTLDDVIKDLLRT